MTLLLPNPLDAEPQVSLRDRPADEAWQLNAVILGPTAVDCSMLTNLPPLPGPREYGHQPPEWNSWRGTNRPHHKG
jgi:hypothetical protein